VTIITDPVFYAIAIPAVVALGLSKGGFAGVGQVATPLLALYMPPLEAAAIMLPIVIVQDAAALWVYRKEWNGRIVAIMTPGAIAGVAIAGVLAAHISNDAVRVFIAVFAIGYVLWIWIGPAQIARETGNPAVPSGVFWGALSGFTSTIAQAGAPPYTVYVLALKLPKMLFVGTTAYFFAGVNYMKVVPYLALGQFSAKGFATSLALLPLAILTNLLGFWLIRVTPQETFYRIMYALMFVISLELLREGVLGLLRGL
jgi:uncharacterized membrane protein YfcA